MSGTNSISDATINNAQSLVCYSQQPLAVFANGGKWPRPEYKFSLVACARWETRYIVEWLIYHRSLGVDHVFLYCNDDDPSSLYREVLPFLQEEKPFVTFLHYRIVGQQFQIYMHFLHHRSHLTKWYMFIDVDEFLCIKGSNNIEQFMNRFDSKIDAVYFNWCGFGINGHAERPPGDVLTNYTRREVSATPYTKVFIKSKSVPYSQIYYNPTAHINHDYTLLNRNLRVVNVVGDDYSGYYDNFPSNAWKYLNSDSIGQRLLDVAFIAHFNMKSDADFELRAVRSRKGTFQNQNYWTEKSPRERNLYHELTNKIEDRYLANYWSQCILCTKNYSVFPVVQWPLISEGCKATQSSTAHPRTIEQDAECLLTGEMRGASQAHTLEETNPWWEVDLFKVFYVCQMQLFNRMDGYQDRMSRIVLMSSLDNVKWTVQYEKTDNILFGGVDGSPLNIVFHRSFKARWLRLVAKGERIYFHLDQAQFFGLEVSECLL